MKKISKETEEMLERVRKNLKQMNKDGSFEDFFKKALPSINEVIKKDQTQHIKGENNDKN